MNNKRSRLTLSPIRLRGLLCASLCASLCMSVATSINARDLTVDVAKSSIQFQFSQLGVPLKGRFTKFEASVFFDAKKLDATKANFTVDINSVDLGAADYNAETKKPVWLDGVKFPSATFVADKVTAVTGNGATGKFEATGKLNIKGISQPIKAQFSFTEGAQPIVEGSFPMKRLAWNVGDAEWKDTSVVADEVMVKFKFVTMPKSATSTTPTPAPTSK
jgi:polyisoprenoid-binding protein YceI